MENIVVRIEREEDFKQVELITRQAFSYPGRVEKGGIGCPFEHWMVHKLRKRDGIQELSFVAEYNGKIVGHIIGSKACIELPKNSSIKVLNFGPLSVLPEYQRKGVGKALLNTFIDRAREMDYGAIMFFGRPEYYPQFGFVEASDYGVTDCFGHNYPAFMAMELKSNYLNGASGGKFYESDIFNEQLHCNEVKEFDRYFLKGINSV